MTSETSTFAISRLAQIAIKVDDVQRATEFYRDKLRLPFLFTTGTLSFLDCAGVRLMLTRAERPEDDHLSSILYFAVSDIHSAHRNLQDAGVKLEDQPHLIAKMPTHDLWMTHFRDSENNLLSLMSEVPRSE